MSLPESFIIFSPSFSLVKTLSPTEYLAFTQKFLARLPRYKDIALVTAGIAFSTFFISLAVAVVIEDEAKEAAEIVNHLCLRCITFSFVTFILSVIAYIAIPLVIKPLLERRIEWLQAKISSN